MDDTEKPDADNSGTHKVQREVVYYYNRENRLSRASPEVQAFNDGLPVRPSLKKTLFATPSHKLIFTAVILFTIVALLMSRFTREPAERGVRLGRNVVALAIQSVDGILVLEIFKQAPKSGELYVGAVDIAVSPVSENPPMFTHRIVFSLLESEVFHIVLPFDGTDFFMVLKAGDEQKTLRLKALSP